MYFKNQLEKVRRHNINIIAVEIASEVECFSKQLEITNEMEFEKVCYFIEDCYLKSENLSISVLCEALCIVNGFYKNNILITLKNVKRCDVIDVACYLIG